MALSQSDLFRRVTTWIPCVTTSNSPPGGTVGGDRVLVGAAGAGAYAGHSNEIATDDGGGGWTFIAPSASTSGWGAYTQDTSTLYGWSGAAWISLISFGGVHGIWTPDKPPTSGSALDYESAQGIPGSYAEWDFGGRMAAPYESEGSICLDHTGNGALNFAGVAFAVPSSQFTVVAKMGAHDPGGAVYSFGLALLEDATDPTGDLVLAFNNSDTNIYVKSFTAYNGSAGALAGPVNSDALTSPIFFMWLVDGADVECRISRDGLHWLSIYTGTIGFVPAQVCPTVQCDTNGKTIPTRVLWLRVKDGTSTFGDFLPGGLI